MYLLVTLFIFGGARNLKSLVAGGEKFVNTQIVLDTNAYGCGFVAAMILGKLFPNKCVCDKLLAREERGKTRI